MLSSLNTCKRFVFLFLILNSILIYQTNSKESYYDILNVPQNASQNEIKKAFKKLCLVYHPDKNQNDKENAKKMFIKVANAYEVLSDPKKKSQYDRSLEVGNISEENTDSNWGMNFNFDMSFEDVFNSFFKSHSGNTGDSVFEFDQYDDDEDNPFGTFFNDIFDMFEDEDEDEIRFPKGRKTKHKKTTSEYKSNNDNKSSSSSATENIFNNSGIIMLSSKNFSRFLKKKEDHVQYMVLMYSTEPDDPFASERLDQAKQVFNVLYKNLQNKFDYVKLARVNCDKEMKICEDIISSASNIVLDNQDLPCIMYLSAKLDEVYRGNISTESILTYLSLKLSSYETYIDEMNYSDIFLNHKSSFMRVISFKSSHTSQIFNYIMKQVSNPKTTNSMNNVYFYESFSHSLAQLFEINLDISHTAVVIITDSNNFKGIKLIFKDESEISYERITNFIHSNGKKVLKDNKEKDNIGMNICEYLPTVSSTKKCSCEDEKGKGSVLCAILLKTGNEIGIQEKKFMRAFSKNKSLTEKSKSAKVNLKFAYMDKKNLSNFFARLGNSQLDYPATSVLLLYHNSNFSRSSEKSVYFYTGNYSWISILKYISQIIDGDSLIKPYINYSSSNTNYKTDF